MSAKTKAPESIQDWQALHQQWWSSLLEGAKQYTPPAGFNAADPLKGFGEVFGHQQGGQNNAAVERFLGGSKQFLEWVQGLSAQIAARGGIPGKVDDWSALFKQSAGPMFEGNNPFLHLFQGLGSDGARGLEQFMAGMPNPADAFKGEMKSMLAMPVFGHTREQQERAQQLGTAYMEYQEAMAAYNAQMLRASKLSYEKLELKLAEREEPGRQLVSLRAVYDLWIDAAEDAYAEVALSAEFRSAYGNLVNRQMRMRQLMQAEVERQTAQFGMPTRTELNSVHQRMQDMRRRMRELEDRFETADSTAAPAARTVAPTSAARRKAVPSKQKRKVVALPVKTAATKVAKKTQKKVAKKIAMKVAIKVKPAATKSVKPGKSRTSKSSNSANKSTSARRQLNRLA
ncbi:MAG: class III poly(R)-hydroxyalkanoic acid synthase subunit PhaE [Pseudomonadota bacterium]|nr:class III poly(R)-hydroxyalkanoic acid synthase subunit PhaE [Pseudomonadota bacterium]